MFVDKKQKNSYNKRKVEISGDSKEPVTHSSIETTSNSSIQNTKNANPYLQQDPEKYGSLFLNSSLPYVVLATDSSILSMNAAAYKFLNRNKTDNNLKNFKSFLFHGNHYLIDNLLSCTLLLNRKQSVETELSILDRMVPVLLSASVVPGSYECFIEIQDLSRQQTFNELTAREHALYTLFEEAGVGIFIADITGRYLSVNKFGCDMLGYSADEMVKMNIKDVLVPEELKTAPIQMHEMLMGHRVISKRNMIRKDGTILPVEISGKTLSDGRLQGIVRDITAQIKAENALKASEQNYKHAESIAHLGSWQMDIKTGKSKWSDEFFRICGFEPQSFEPTRHMRFSVIHPDDRQMCERIIQQAIAEKKPYKLEKRVIRPWGEIRHILSVGEIILDSRNKPVELKGIFLDITDLKKTELSLKKSEENYRSLVEFLPIGLLIKNHRGEVLFGNTKSKEILNLETLKLNELKSTGELKVIRKDETILPVEEYPDSIVISKGKMVENLELGVVFGERKIWINVTAAPIPDRDEVIVAFMDITDKIIKEKQMNDLSEKLQKINATKDKFFSIIAHDLKNPFNTIMGFSDLMVKNIHNYTTEEILKFAEIINDSSLKTYALLDNLLIWARTQSDTLEYNSGKYDLNEIVEENIRFVEPIAIKKQVRIKYRSNGKALVFADKNMIDTVLRNLLTNAIKFSFPESEIHVISAEDEQNYFYSIRDYGVGISPLDIQKLFKLDSKISMPGTQNEKGSGLGLLICKEFMEKIGGYIVVTSELGKGSEFKLVLPKAFEE